MRIITLSLMLVVGVACNGGNVGVEEIPYCNGRLDKGESEIDDVFDDDGDGAFDADAGCAETYPPEEVDCDDDNADIGPQLDEVECNDVDDDCDELTPDDDGFGCAEGYNGTFTVTPPVSYSCAGAVNATFSELEVVHDEFQLDMTSVGAAQPGTMTGTTLADKTFRVSRSISGICTENYEIVGSFDDPSNFTGTLTIGFVDSSGLGIGCGNCADQSFSITGAR